ncbi:EAL and HDOD domain-containing protein [Chitinimonas taiwanensis]|uniref:EAL and modified HD-GYP domain-containing signal transduction protein n=1 Tax=Chitinimonas taiwanensis DSM 18899 TaxID=1121279 RepID=A0A1K2HD17_9NEIS|nr:EAL domain-containing protein [Chitinimonas taiwanensis]SFZ74202.1 EAL and modified HD-GYP domain-containing signal transduction protein [Chitinimonas taiwanensis DSM 18899]
MSTPQFFLGRQAIVGRQRELFAYELLFRTSQHNAAAVTDDVAASAAVMQHAFTGLGLQAVLEDKLGFINLSEPLLMSEVIEVLPRERVVLEILETVALTPAVIERCRALKATGYRLALDDVIGFTPAQQAILPLLEVVKLDVLAMPPEQTAALVKALKPCGVKILAEKVDSPAQHDFCHQLGCDLFQGYYFARPTILSGKPVQPSAMLLLKLLGQVAADAEIDELEDTLKHAPDLTVQLLRLVNSVAFGLPRKIASVRTGINLLGRAQLHRWLQIMVFAQQSGGRMASDPLVQTAAVRGHLMELLAEALRPGQLQLADQAFMVGMLSLVDALFGHPMPTVLQALNLEAPLQQALLERSGWLGRLLSVVEALETGSAADIDAHLAALGGLSADALNHMQVQALHWASQLGRESAGDAEIT